MCIPDLECSYFGYKNGSICSCKFFFFLFLFLILLYKKLACDNSCSKCNGPSSTDCLECSGSKSLLNGKCLSECPSGYFISGNQCQCNF